MEDATARIDGYNPLCGDHYTVFLKTEGETIREVSFTGSGCAISKASASVMSSTVKGKSKEEAERLFETFHKLVTGDASGLSASDLGRLAAFSGVSEFPARVKCATLAWHTLRSALEGKADEKVSTE
jgi:nitrogen fixation protein NifU and related proteins